MELDVHLKRSTGEPWGFELTGGSDMPIKINTVLTSSPASEAGLKAGDVLTKVQGADTRGLPLDRVVAAIEDVTENMRLGVTRGLYDPVIDDDDPIYNTYEPADSDRRSEATEVQFKIQQFTQTPAFDTNVGPKPLRPTRSMSNLLLQPEPIREPRSLTPFDESKRYRPFSTEPLHELPPLENPIILNPNYRDAFSRSLGKNDENESKETKFKLPVSNQYDPDGSKKKTDKRNDVIERRVIHNTKEILKYVNTDENKKDRQCQIHMKAMKSNNILIQEDKERNSLSIENEKKNEESQFIKKNKQDIDLTNVEETPLKIVKENIENALSITAEIKKEIDHEHIQDTSVIFNIESEDIIGKENRKTDSKEITHTIKRNKKHPIQYDLMKLQKDHQNINASNTIKKENILAQNEIETIKQHTDERIIEQSLNESKQEIKKQAASNIVKVITHSNPPVPNASTRDTTTCIVAQQQFERELPSVQKDNRKFNAVPVNTVKNITIQKEYEKPSLVGEKTYKSEAENRVYAIGLQTIPNICGVVNSSQLNLLLKTFFVRLTDIMVALSKFVLTKPLYTSFEDRQRNSHNNVIQKFIQIKRDKHEDMGKSKDNGISESRTGPVKKETIIKINIENKDLRAMDSIKNAEQKQKDIKLCEKSDEETRNSKIDKIINGNRIEEECMNMADKIMEAKKTGAKMSQLCEKKSEGITPIMNSVISEFQSKAAIEEKHMAQCRRRSRSRSQIEEEVMRESDPLEWLAKVDSKRISQESKVSSKQQISSKLESESRFKTSRESRRFSFRKPKPTKQMYVAVVESHIYTNENAIFEDKSPKISGFSSLQSSETVNTSYKTTESVFTEEHSILCSDFRENKAKVIDTVQIPVQNAKSETNVEIIEQLEDNISNSSHKPTSQTASATHQTKEVFVQEIQQVIEPVQTLPEKAKTIKSIQSCPIKDQFSLTTAETTEIADLTEVKLFDVKQIKAVKGNISSGNSYSALIVTEVEPEMSNLIDFKVLKMSPAKPSLVLECKTAVEISEIESTDNNITELKVSDETPKTIHSVGVHTENIAYQVTTIESENDIFDVKILDKNTQIATINTIIQIENALQINEIYTLKDDICNLELLIEKLKTLDSIGVVEHKAVIVNEIKADKDELIDLNIANEIKKTAKIDFVEGTHIAIQVFEMEALKGDLTEFNVAQVKAKTIQLIDFFPQRAIEICETEATKNELIVLNISKEQPKEVDMSVVEHTLMAIQITETESESNELYKLESNNSIPQTIDSIECVNQVALDVTEVELTKDNLCDLNISIIPIKMAKVGFIERKHKAIEINEIQSLEDCLAESYIQNGKLHNVQAIGVIENVALIINEVEAANDNLNKINICTDKSQRAKLGIVESTENALQIDETKTLIDDVAELNVSTYETHLIALVDFVEQFAVNIVEVDAIKQEICELQVPQNKKDVARMKITKKESKALQILEIEPVDDEIAEIQIVKHEMVNISLSMTLLYAIIISEIESKKDEFTELNVKKQQFIYIVPILVLEERSLAVQIIEIEPIRDEIIQLEILKPKSMSVSKSLAEIASALQISEVETTKDEFAELHTKKHQTAEVLTSITEKQLSAIVITEVEPAQDDIAELNIKNHQFVGITPSLEVGRAPSAVQIIETDSIRDEMAELNILKPKSMSVSKSFAEIASALEISEVETRKDEFAELHTKKHQTAEVLTSTTGKQSSAIVITEVEPAQDDIGELNIKNHQFVGITPSLQVGGEPSAVQIIETESIRDEIAELNILKPKSINVSKSFAEIASVLEISEVETRKDEFAELHTKKHQTAEVLTSITEKQLSAIVITEVEPAQDDIAELNIKNHQFVGITPSLEVGRAPSAVQIIETDSIRDEMAELNMLKPKSMSVSKSFAEIASALEISEVETRKDEFAELHTKKHQTAEVLTSTTEKQSSAIVITEVEPAQDDIGELNIKNHQFVGITPSLQVDGEPLAVQIIETESIRDEMAELNILKPKSISVSKSFAEIASALEISEVETRKDEFAELHTKKHQTAEVLTSTTGKQSSAIVITEVEPAQDDIGELNIKNHQFVGITPSLQVGGEPSAVQIIETESIRDEIAELNILKPKSINVSKSFAEIASVLEISEVETRKDEFAELHTKKHQTAEVLTSITEKQLSAIVITEVEPAQDDIAELNIKNHQFVGITPSLEVGRAPSAVQIIETDSIRDEMAELNILKPKSMSVSKSFAEIASALEISEVETRKDEFAELHTKKHQTAEVLTSTTGKQSSAIVITEVEPAQDDIGELNIKNHQFVGITPSLQVGGEPSAVQIIETESIRDEIAELNILKPKSINVSKSFAEIASVLEISEIETKKDELTELYTTQQQTEEVSTSITRKKSNAIKIAEVESVQDEIAELNIKKHQCIDIKPSIEVTKEPSAVQITEIESIRDEITELNVPKPKAVSVFSTSVTGKKSSALLISEVESTQDEIAELNIKKHQSIGIKPSFEVGKEPSAVQITEIESIKDEMTELNAPKPKAVSVFSTSVTGKKSSALLISEVESTQDEIAELNIKKHQSIGIKPSFEVGKEPSAVQIIEIESIRDEMTELNVPKPKAVGVSMTFSGISPALQISEIEIRKDELTELYTTQQQTGKVSTSITRKKSNAIKIAEVEAAQDETTELNIKKHQFIGIKPSFEVGKEPSAVQITEIESIKDEMTELNAPKPKAVSVSSTSVTGKKSNALLVSEVESAQDEIAELNIKKHQSIGIKPSFEVGKEPSAVQITEIESIRDEMTELNVPKPKTMSISKSFAKISPSLQISEVETSKDELTELYTKKQQRTDISTSLNIKKSKAHQITEVETAQDKLAECNIKNEQVTVTIPSLKVERKPSTIQITEIESIKDERANLNLSKQKTLNASESVVEKTPSFEISKVERIKDNFAKQTISKKQRVKFSTSITAKKSNTLQVSDAEESENEFSELNIKKHQFIDITPSSEIYERPTAVEITEIQSITNETADFNISNKKTMESPKSVVELAPALAISKTVTSKNEITERCTSKSKKELVQTSLIGKMSNARQITEIDRTHDKSNIKKHTFIDVTPSLVVDAEPSTEKILEIHSKEGDTAELNLSKQKSLQVPEYIAESQTIHQIKKSKTRKDESSDLYVAKKKTQSVSTSLNVKKSSGPKITDVETIQDEFAELNIRKHQFVDTIPSLEVNENASAMQITEMESVANEMGVFNMSEQKSINVNQSMIETESKLSNSEAETRKCELYVIKQDTADVSASVKARKSKYHKIREVGIAQDVFAELSIKKQSSSVEMNDDESTNVEITEIDSDEDLTENELAQNGSAETVIEQDSALEIENREARNKHARFKYARGEIKKDKVKSVVNIQEDSAVKVGIQVKQSEVAKSKQETEKVKIDHKKTSHHIESIRGRTEMSEEFKSSDTISESISKNTKKLTLQTKLSGQSVTAEQEVTSPSPPILPPTPLTDEYIFRLKAPLPKSRGTTPIPPDYFEVTAKREDPHIVKKKLVPHIEMSIERIIYDPPLLSPPDDKSLPFYTKPGLRGGVAYSNNKAEIQEIEKKSSLLASDIDQTIKNIEDYKQDVGIETKKEIKEEASKSEYTITKTTTEHRVINEIIKNDDTSTEEHFTQKTTIDTNDKERPDVDKQTEENKKDLNELSKNITNANENVTKLETIIKINLNTDTATETPSTLPDQQETKSRDEIPLKVVEGEPINVNEVDITEKAKKETSNRIEIHDESSVNIEEIDIARTNEGQQYNDSCVSDVIITEVKTPQTVVEETKCNSTERNDNIKKINIKKLIDTNIDNNNASKKEEEKIDYLQFVKPVRFDPDAVIRSSRSSPVPIVQEPVNTEEKELEGVKYDGGLLEAIERPADGLVEPAVDEKVLKDSSKQEILEERITDLVPGEEDALREAHVMGLSRIISAHMQRDEGRVDLTVDSPKDFEDLTALNEKIVQKELEEERRKTTFLRKPQRPVPKVRYGCQGYGEEKGIVEEPYRVVIIKQPKPKIAPDFRPEEFDTGPLPWEERSQEDVSLPLINREEPILIPEEPPQFLKAVSPLPEIRIPVPEDIGTGAIPLPFVEIDEQQVYICKEPASEVMVEEESSTSTVKAEERVLLVGETETKVDRGINLLTEEFVKSFQNTLDPNESLERQLEQMKAQLAALAKLPAIIQQTLELLSEQLAQLTVQSTQKIKTSFESQINAENVDTKLVQDMSFNMPE